MLEEVKWHFILIEFSPVLLYILYILKIFDYQIEYALLEHKLI